MPWPTHVSAHADAAVYGPAASRASVAGAEGFAPGALRGPWREALHRLRGDRSAVAGAVALGIIVSVAALAPVIAPYDPAAQLDILALRSQPPSLAHPLGTDPFGRDLLSRLLHGARLSLGVSLLAVALAATIGVAWGAVAGYVGGLVDAAMMRIVDALLSIPSVLLLVAVVTLWGGVGLVGLVLLLGATSWFGVSRLVRALVIGARAEEFVTSARALGASDARILAHHILPQVVSPVLVAATLGVANVIVVEAGLSFLGLGAPPPAASWGAIIHDGLEVIASAWWVSFFPGLAIVLTVLAVHLVADGLREALNARQVPAR